MNRCINIEYENDNYRLISYDEKEFNLLDLKNGTFKTLEIMWHTTLEDIVEFVCDNVDDDFILEYLPKLLDTIDDEEDKQIIIDVLNDYRGKHI